MPSRYFLTPVADRFWPRVEKTEECWLWKGHCDHKFGHGTIGRGRRGDGHWLTHRLAWVLAGEEDDPSVAILHTCDVPNCVRNDDTGVYVLNGVEYRRHGHLFAADRTVNMEDKVSKGRQQVGESVLSARLNEQQVRDIRNRFENRKVITTRTTWGDPNSITAIAKEYGISYVTVFDLVHRKTWKHIE